MLGAIRPERVGGIDKLSGFGCGEAFACAEGSGPLGDRLWTSIFLLHLVRLNDMA